MKNLTVKDLVLSGIILLAVCLCVKFIALINSVIMIGVLALIFSTILNGPVSFLVNKGCNRTVSAILTLLCVFFIVGGIIALIVPETAKEIEAVKKQAPSIENELEYKLDKLAKKNGLDLSKIKESEFINNKIEEYTPTILTGATKVGKSVFGVIVHTVLIILLMVYILSDPKPLLKGFLDPWNFNTKKSLRRCLLRVERMLYAWAIGLCCGMLCMFLLTWFGLTMLKMEGAFLFAVIAGFLNIIPTLGPFLAAILPVCITFVTKPFDVIWVLIIYIGMHQIESHIMTPLIMRKQLSIHPMVLILSILVMFFFYGMIGAFITAPFMATLSIIYDEFVVIPRKYKSFN